MISKQSTKGHILQKSKHVNEFDRCADIVNLDSRTHDCAVRNNQLRNIFRTF